MWITSSLNDIKTPTAIALGNFDGIHRGHQAVLRPILDFVGKADSPHCPMPTVVTFHPHPKAFFSGRDCLLLTPLAEKVQILSQLGIQQLVRLPFNQTLANLSPSDFVREILIQSLDTRYISVGADFCFGYQRQGTSEDLSTLAQGFGIVVAITPLLAQSEDRISSSRIRQALAIADLAAVRQMLGRSYSLLGRVVEGQRLGRTIGFPTANLSLPSDKLLPACGVYGVRVGLSETDCLGVMNLGLRPTVAGQSLAAEVHLLDWKGDLYGREIEVSLEVFLRSEQKFPSLDALKRQIESDCIRVRQYFGGHVQSDG